MPEEIQDPVDNTRVRVQQQRKHTDHCHHGNEMREVRNGLHQLLDVRISYLI